jgi:hypothetical protein
VGFVEVADHGAGGVCSDMVDIGGSQPGKFDCPGRSKIRPLADGVRCQDVKAVRGDTGGYQSAKNVGTACLGFAEYKTIAVLAEWAAGAGRIVVGGRQHDAHGSASGDRRRLDPGLDPRQIAMSASS